MNNKLAVAASLLVALVFTVVLLLSAGGKGGKTEKPVKPEKTDIPEQARNVLLFNECLETLNLKR